MRKKSLIFILVAIPFLLKASVVDSLSRQLNQVRGKERILVLNELAYQLMYEKPIEAIAYGREALVLASNQSDSLLYAQTCNDISLPFLVTGDFDSVIHYNELAYGIRMRHRDYAKAGANLAKLAQAFYEKADYKKSFYFQNQAYRMYLAQKDTGRLVNITNALGVLFEKFGQTQQAEFWYKRSETWAMQMGMERDYYIAKMNLGILARRAGGFVKAESIFESCRDFFEQNAYSDDQAHFFESIGVLYRSTGRSKLGEASYLKALQANEELGSKPGIAMCYRNLGYCLQDQNKVKEAIAYFEKAWFISNELGLADQLQLIEFDLYESWKKLGDSNRALHWLEKHKASSDSVYSYQTRELATEYSARFELEKHRSDLLLREKELLHAQLDIKRRNLWLIIAFSVLVLGISALIFFRREQLFRRLKWEEEAKNQLNEERLRIARDLHDNLGADLSWITSELDVHAYAENNPSHRLRYEAMADKMREAGRSLRDTLWAIYRNEGNLNELVSRLQNQSNMALQQAGIGFDADIPETPIELSPTVSLHLYRILKELINNTIKHSGATRIHMKALKQQEVFRITYQDNGRGISDNSGLEGYGLTNIKTRAEEAGFEFKWSNLPEGGVQLVLTKQMQSPV